MTEAHDRQIEEASIAHDHAAMVERVIGAMRVEQELLTLGDYADIAGVSPFYFNRIFKSVIGIPPGEFATSLRFERAKQLLLTTPASVTDVCFEVGYESLGTFSSRFKKLVGVTPAGFRQLPDAVADLDFGRSTFRVDPRMLYARGRVEGTMQFPQENAAFSLFVGVYPAALAASVPVTGRMITEPGEWELPHVPFGTWIVLSAAVPRMNDPVSHLLPANSMLVASSEVIVLTPDAPLARVHLAYRAPGLLEPPVLTALPALLLN